MKTDPRRFAPLGLVLSLLAALCFIVVLIIKGLASAKVFSLPDAKVLDQAIWISLAVFVLGLALTAFLDPEGTRKFFVGRQVQYGSNAVIMMAAFLGVLFFANFIVYEYTKNTPPFDVTEGQQNSLAPETLNMLKTLTKPVTARAYYSSQVSRSEIQKLLDNFKQNSNGKLTYEFIDPVLDPVSAQIDNVTRDGTVVMHMESRKEIVSMASEKDLDSAILRLINPEQRALYFLTGHGERDTENQGDTSLTLVKAALQSKNYTVKLLNLGNEGKVPADAKVIIIAGPQQPITTDEAAILQAYLDKGGALIAMEDPRQLTQFGTAPDPLADILKKWGVTLQDDIIIDTNSTNPLLVYADPQNYGSHPITDKLRGFNALFFTARSLKLDTAPEGITLTPLAQTLPNTWGETNFKSIEDKTAVFDSATDNKSPLILGAAAQNSVSKARLVVFGDSEFATDTLYQKGNGDILINAIDWAAEQENLISLTPKNNISRTYEQPGTAGLIGIILLSLCGIPLLVVSAGVAAWYSRRRRG
jgi:ABC-type uncharacterized transport system involved in gliding motility auxiliary subunit